MLRCFLSLIIPAYNEEKRILPTLEKVYSYLSKQDYSFEIIIVDDGSTDETVKIVKNFIKNKRMVNVLTNGENRGKGFTVKNGILSAKGNYIFFTDADLSTPIEELEKCIPHLTDNFDIVIGSRSLPESNIEIRQPFYREKMGKIFNLLVKMFLLKGVIDTQCGFKGFKKDAVKNIFNRSVIDGFSFDVETIFLAQKYKFKIKEIPVRWRNSELSKVSPIKHSLQMFFDLMHIRFNNLKGNYD